MITVIGEALVDLVAVPGSRTYTAYPGGSPANVAVGLARLGAPTSLLARIGPDVFGRMLREHLEGNGVDPRDLIAASEPSSLAVASLDPAGVATYDFWVDGTADWQWRDDELPDPLADDVEALHAGSLASWMEPSAGIIERLLVREHSRSHVTLSLDPNCRPSLMGGGEESRQRIEREVSLVDVVKVSEEDLRWLCPGQTYQQVAKRWLSIGPALVTVTLGAYGAYALTRACEVQVPGFPVNVVDTVGAGDAFTAGLLDGLRRARLFGGAGRDALYNLNTGTLRRLLAEAVLVASLTCARAGADPPTRGEVHRLNHGREAEL